MPRTYTRSATLERCAPHLTDQQLAICEDHERHQDEPAPGGWDVAEAIYWFASFNYQGVGDPLYAALCATDFAPGALANTVTPGTSAATLYADLVETLR